MSALLSESRNFRDVDERVLTAGQPNAVTASPATAWTSGQYVQTGTSGTAGRAHWSGTAWVAGAKP